MSYAQLHPAGVLLAPGNSSDLLALEAAAARIFEQRLVMAILLATMTYQSLLCLINTHIFPASRTLIGITEALLYLACIPILARRLLPGVIIIAAFCGAILCLLTLLNGQLDAKAFRDLIIPLCYFWLGCNVGRTDLADRILIYGIGIVLALGFMELWFLDQYTDVFDIFGYYVNIGNLQPITDYVRESRLQLNGIRPDGIGRTLLPDLLGSHRISSVFLEPVSLGNFATMCAAWGLSKEKEQLRLIIFFVVMAVVMMVLSDSRFALISVTLMVAMRLFIHGKALNLAIIGPFIAIAMLIVLGITTTGTIGDDFRGRLALSGWSLLEFDISTLMGASRTDNYADEGYAHLLSKFGFPVCLLLWFSFWFLPMPDERGERFRAFASIYIALILCVSGYSLFALKSAGVLWFLVGCALCNPAPYSSTVESRKQQALALFGAYKKGLEK